MLNKRAHHALKQVPAMTVYAMLCATPEVLHEQRSNTLEADYLSGYGVQWFTAYRGSDDTKQTPRNSSVALTQ